MNRKRLILTIMCVVAVLAAAVVTWHLTKEQGEPDHIFTNDHPTNGAQYFTDGTPPADPLLVGQWSNARNPKWHKVYYDDYDAEQKLYWGKEWDEAEDVFEEDLNYHGNGWFRWKKQGKVLHEYHTMDMADVPIHREYRLCCPLSDSLVYIEPDYPKDVFTFYRSGIEPER